MNHKTPYATQVVYDWMNHNPPESHIICGGGVRSIKVIWHESYSPDEKNDSFICAKWEDDLCDMTCLRTKSDDVCEPHLAHIRMSHAISHIWLVWVQVRWRVWTSFGPHMTCVIWLVCGGYSFGPHMNESCHITHMTFWVQVRWRDLTSQLVWTSFGPHTTCVIWLVCGGYSFGPHMNESWHTYEWVMPYHTYDLFASYHTYDLFDAFICGPNESCHTYEWNRNVRHTNESCHTYEQVMPCHTYEWVMSHVCMSRVTPTFSKRQCPAKKLYTRVRHATHMNESCHTYEWVMSRIWMSHVTHTNASCHTCEWVNAHT